MSGVLLAVDGGNSKTDVVVLARDGTVIGAHRGPTVSHQQVSIEEAGRRLRAQVDALRGPGQAIEASVLCLAGLDFPADERALARAHGNSGFGRVVLENDTVAGLCAGSPSGWGVGIVVGAGINAVGVASDGRRARFAGLGPLSGDRGGGGGLGLAALGAAVRAGDGRGGRTSLEALVPAHFGVRRPIDVTLAMYHGRLAEDRLAELAPVAVRAARDGDAVALGLLGDLADECASFATASIRRLGMTRLEVPVVLSGGVARGAGELLAAPVEDRVRAVAPAAAVSVLHAPPVLGAALLALDLVVPGDRAAADRARAGISAASFAG